MIIGSYGTFWDRGLVDWNTRNWGLLGAQGANTGTLKVADFRRVHGVYVLYSQVNVSYVGLADGEQGLGGRLKNHLSDKHENSWILFSWFAFDAPDKTTPKDADGVLRVSHVRNPVELTPKVVIRDLEALLQVAMQPLANQNKTRFARGSEWRQVATSQPQASQFADIKDRLVRPPRL